MCGCNSSFDGEMENVDQIEVARSFSFVQDIESDSEFNDFFTKKMREKGRKRRELRSDGYSRKDARRIVSGKMDLPSSTGAYEEELPDAGAGGYGGGDDEGMSTTTKALIGVGIASVVGVLIYLAKRGNN
jgi:hypothetical protein|tara:strand:- start:1627 stop:2016 length:390 start_codon:yes stop_codon:yes gene_type:complete